MTIRGDTINYSYVKKKKKKKKKKERKKNKEEENKLEQEINELGAEINNDFSSIAENKITNFARKKETLIEIRKEKIEGVMLRSRSRYQELGEAFKILFFLI